MAFLKRIAGSIAWLGESAFFVACMAHCWFAYAVLYTFFSLPLLAGMVVVFAAKEFWFDVKFEAGETISSSTEHFISYLLGIALASGVHYFL